MKTNIEQITYDGKPSSTGKWWRWHETCDICGADCGKDDFQTMTKPDTNEKDYCLSCLRKLLKDRVKEREELWKKYIL